LGHLQDQEAKAKAKANELLDELKKVFGDDFQLIFMDETALSLDPPLRACWMKVGLQRRIPATRPGTKQ